MSFKQRIEENMRQIAAQSPGVLALNLVVVIGVLGVMAAIGFIPVGGLIGGTIGYLAVNIWARLRYGGQS